MKTYRSGSKPRFDGKGSLFGDLHRELPPDVCMFDIDSMFARIDITIRKENKGFVEYRHNRGGVIFTALFEIKYKYGEISIDPTISVNIARQQMAKMLGCRLFVVFRDDGKKPFWFYEFKGGKYEFVYALDYDKQNREEKIKECWKELGLLKN